MAQDGTGGTSGVVAVTGRYGGLLDKQGQQCGRPGESPPSAGPTGHATGSRLGRWGPLCCETRHSWLLPDAYPSAQPSPGLAEQPQIILAESLYAQNQSPSVI